MAKGTVSDTGDVKKILVYTFYSRWKKCSKWLYEASQSKIYPITSLIVPNRFSTGTLLASLTEYQYVIGIADHSKVAKSSRFDQSYINRYGRRVLLEFGEEYLESNLKISLPESFKMFTKTTNGPCNRSAYLCMNEINSKKLSTKFGFLHICPSKVEEDIQELLSMIIAL